MPRHSEALLAFCLRQQNDDWSNVLFTDESRVSTSPDCPVMWWVKKGDHLYLETDKFPLSVMIWAGIIGSRRTRLIKCPQRLDAAGYVAMLEQHRIVESITHINDDAIIQQDGAPCHRAASTRRLFDS